MKKIRFALYGLVIMATACGGKKAPDMMDKLVYMYEVLTYHLRMHQENNEKALRVLITNTRNTVGDTPESIKLMKSFEILRRKTDTLVQYIDVYKRKIARKIGQGIDSKTNMLRKPHAISGLYDLMTDTQQEYNAKNLQKALDVYVKYLNRHFEEYFPNPFSSLTRTPSEMDFATYYFSNTSVIIALYMLTNFQSEILRYENECIQRLTPMNESRGFDWIYPLVDAESNQVQEGDEYVARIRLVQKPHSQRMDILVNSIPIKVNAVGVGEVRWKVSGKGKQTWKGNIKTRIRGRDTTFTIYPTYEVIPRKK